MTTPTTLQIALYGDDPSHNLLLHKLPDERWILKAILELQRDAAAYLLDCASRDLDGDYSVLTERALTQFDYNGDHVDYNPAAARCLALITDELCGDGYSRDQLNADIVNALAIPDSDWHDDFIRTPRALLAFLLTDTDFLENYDTWGGPSDNPLFDLEYID